MDENIVGPHNVFFAKETVQEVQENVQGVLPFFCRKCVLSWHTAGGGGIGQENGNFVIFTEFFEICCWAVYEITYWENQAEVTGITRK